MKNTDSSCSGNSYQKYCSNMTPNSMFCEPVMDSELVSLINKLNTNKAAGPDSIDPKLLKVVAPVILSPLLHIFNLSFSTGVFPDRLKLAKVIPTRPIELRNTYSAKHGLAIACRLSVRPSACDVGGSGSHRLKVLENNCTDNTASLFSKNYKLQALLQYALELRGHTSCNIRMHLDVSNCMTAPSEAIIDEFSNNSIVAH